MSKKRKMNKLFFSRTLDFLNHYLPEQAMKSNNTIETYRDALTVFRRYISDTLHLSIRSFCFEDCTHDLLLEYLCFMNANGNAATTCNKGRNGSSVWSALKKLSSSFSKKQSR